MVVGIYQSDAQLARCMPDTIDIGIGALRLCGRATLISRHRAPFCSHPRHSNDVWLAKNQIIVYVETVSAL